MTFAAPDPRTDDPYVESIWHVLSGRSSARCAAGQVDQDRQVLAVLVPREQRCGARQCQESYQALDKDPS